MDVYKSGVYKVCAANELGDLGKVREHVGQKTWREIFPAESTETKA